MKRFFTAIASALGISATAAPETKMIDPQSVYFSLATINDALPATDTATSPSTKDLIVHEDDWRQFEAVSLSCSVELKQEIADVQRIFQEKSKLSGAYRIFSGIHIRKRLIRPLPTSLGWTELLLAAGVQPSSVAGVRLCDG